MGPKEKGAEKEAVLHREQEEGSCSPATLRLESWLYYGLTV